MRRSLNQVSAEHSFCPVILLRSISLNMEEQYLTILRCLWSIFAQLTNQYHIYICVNCNVSALVEQCENCGCDESVLERHYRCHFHSRVELKCGLLVFRMCLFCSAKSYAKFETMQQNKWHIA